MANFKHQLVGNVFLMRWTAQARVEDIDAMFAALRAGAAAAGGAPLVGVCVVPADVPLPSAEAQRAMDARYEEFFALLPEAYVVVEPGSLRSARVVTWVVNAIMLARGRSMRMARSVGEALRDARSSSAVPDREVLRRGREGGLIVATDAEVRRAV